MRKKTTLQALTYYFTTNPVNLHTRYEFRSPIPLLTSFTRLLDINNVPRGRNLVDDWEDSYPIDLEYYYQVSVVRDTDSPLEAARIKQSETLVSFFASQLIDIPMCLRPARKSSSSYAGWPKSRFVTTLSRHGQNLKVSRLFAVSMLNLSRKTHLTNEEYLMLWDWRLMHTLLFQPTVIGGNMTMGLPLSLGRSPNFEFDDPMKQNIVLGDQPFPSRNTFNTTFCTKLLEQAPSFSVFIRKVDKMKRRHSRRKTGKYETGWRYVPPYKRLLVVLRWFKRDIRFQRANAFQSRIEHSIDTFLYNSDLHTVQKMRRFVHQSAFRTYKTTLLRTLRLRS